jgi:hypothetical protein
VSHNNLITFQPTRSVYLVSTQHDIETRFLNYITLESLETPRNKLHSSLSSTRNLCITASRYVSHHQTQFTVNVTYMHEIPAVRIVNLQALLC